MLRGLILNSAISFCQHSGRCATFRADVGSSVTAKYESRCVVDRPSASPWRLCAESLGDSIGFPHSGLSAKLVRVYGIVCSLKPSLAIPVVQIARRYPPRTLPIFATHLAASLFPVLFSPPPLPSTNTCVYQFTLSRKSKGVNPRLNRSAVCLVFDRRPRDHRWLGPKGAAMAVAEGDLATNRPSFKNPPIFISFSTDKLGSAERFLPKPLDSVCYNKQGAPRRGSRRVSSGREDPRRGGGTLQKSGSPPAKAARAGSAQESAKLSGVLLSTGSLQGPLFPPRCIGVHQR